MAKTSKYRKLRPRFNGPELQMSKDGIPSIKPASHSSWQEDQLIADAAPSFVPWGDDHKLLEDVVLAHLHGRSVGTEEQRLTFVRNISEIVMKYLTLLHSSSSSRTQLKDKYESIAESFSASAYYIGITTRDEYKLLMKHVTDRIEETGGNADNYPLRSLTPSELAKSLGQLSGNARKLAWKLSSATHTDARPLRYLVFKSLQTWLDVGLPKPKLVRNADADDLYAPDPDAFSETISLILDVSTTKKTGSDAIRHNVRAALKEFP